MFRNRGRAPKFDFPNGRVLSLSLIIIFNSTIECLKNNWSAAVTVDQIFSLQNENLNF